MDLISGIGTYLVPFLVILSVLVFVHELGHYLVARRNGVRIDVFSIGFGPELFGFTDRAGTRWKFSALPLGGYVKMHGDADPTSSTIDLDRACPTPTASRPRRVWQRMAIVAAGPLRQLRRSRSSCSACCSRPSAGRSRRPRSARSSRAAPPRRPACCRATGSSRSIGEPLASFEELQGIVRDSPDVPLTFTIERDGESMDLPVTPRADRDRPIASARSTGSG